MRVLHLINNNEDNDSWLVETEAGPDWCWDVDEAVAMLAKPHTDVVEVRTLCRSDLNTIDEYASFDILWEDRGTPQEFKDAFKACFAFANKMK